MSMERRISVRPNIADALSVQDKIIDIAMSLGGDMAVPTLCCALEAVCKKVGINIIDVADTIKEVNAMLGTTTY